MEGCQSQNWPFDHQLLPTPATLSSIETIRTIKRDHIHNKQPGVKGVKGEIEFINQLFGAA